MGMRLPRGRSSRFIVVAAVASSIKATTRYNNIKKSIKNQKSVRDDMPLKSKLCWIPIFTEAKNIDIRPSFFTDLVSR